MPSKKNLQSTGTLMGWNDMKKFHVGSYGIYDGYCFRVTSVYGEKIKCDCLGIKRNRANCVRSIRDVEWWIVDSMEHIYQEVG